MATAGASVAIRGRRTRITDTESDLAQPEDPAPRAVRLLRLVGLAALVVAVVALFQVSRGDDASTEAVDGGETSPEIGARAPDFTVRTLAGTEFSLSGHLESDGRPVFLNMWAEWCFPCRAEMPAIDAVAAAHPEVHFIGVVVDDEEAPARDFVNEYGIRYEIGLDDDRVVKQAYVVWAMPSTYLIDSDGVIVERIFGPLREAELEEMLELVAAAP